MDLVWPILLLLGALALFATAPRIEEGIKRVRTGIAVMRDELIVQNARKAYGRVKR